MSTQAQIDANRANAQKSSGPISEVGKENSSQNHASHRLSQYAAFRVLDFEDQLLYTDLVLELYSQFEPSDKGQQAIVDRMAQHEWMRRRAIAYLNNILNDDKIFKMQQMALFMRYESQHERAYNSCFNQLLKLRAEKRSANIGFQRRAQVNEQVAQRNQRHELTQKASQVDIDCKIVRTLRNAANNPEALEAAREVKARHQAA